MCHGSIEHMAQIIKLMAQLFHLFPPLHASPRVRMPRVHRACRVEIAVRLLRLGHDIEHTVDVSLKPFVGEALQHIARTLDGFVDIGIVEGELHELVHHIIVARMSGLHEVFVAMFRLALAERQRNRHLLHCFQSFAEERTGREFHACEGHLPVGVARNGRLCSGHTSCR